MKKILENSFYLKNLRKKDFSSKKFINNVKKVYDKEVKNGIEYSRIIAINIPDDVYIFKSFFSVNNYLFLVNGINKFAYKQVDKGLKLKFKPYKNFDVYFLNLGYSLEDIEKLKNNKVFKTFLNSFEKRLENQRINLIEIKKQVKQLYNEIKQLILTIYQERDFNFKYKITTSLYNWLVNGIMIENFNGRNLLYEKLINLSENYKLVFSLKTKDKIYFVDDENILERDIGRAHQYLLGTNIGRIPINMIYENNFLYENIRKTALLIQFGSYRLEKNFYIKLQQNLTIFVKQLSLLNRYKKYNFKFISYCLNPYLDFTRANKYFYDGTTIYSTFCDEAENMNELLKNLYTKHQITNGALLMYLISQYHLKILNVYKDALF